MTIHVVVGTSDRPCSRIYKVFDGNHYEREGRNGRIYYGTVGWRWAVEVDGELLESFATKREALSFANQLQRK